MSSINYTGSAEIITGSGSISLAELNAAVSATALPTALSMLIYSNHPQNSAAAAGDAQSAATTPTRTVQKCNSPKEKLEQTQRLIQKKKQIELMLTNSQNEFRKCLENRNLGDENNTKRLCALPQEIGSLMDQLLQVTRQLPADLK